MIIVKWSVGINTAWMNSPVRYVDDWAEQYGARYVQAQFEDNGDKSIDYLVFDDDEDAIVFKLKFGL